MTDEKKHNREPINPIDPEWLKRLADLCSYAGVDISNAISVHIKSSLNSYVEIDVEYLGTAEIKQDA